MDSLSKAFKLSKFVEDWIVEGLQYLVPAFLLNQLFRLVYFFLRLTNPFDKNLVMKREIGDLL